MRLRWIRGDAQEVERHRSEWFYIAAKGIGDRLLAAKFRIRHGFDETPLPHGAGFLGNQFRFEFSLQGLYCDTRLSFIQNGNIDYGPQ
jgi:hypothetical protein